MAKAKSASAKKKSTKKKSTKTTSKKTKKTSKKKKSPTKIHWDKFPKPSPDDVATAINMKFGTHGPIMRAATDSWDASDLRRPSGIADLDIAHGGGLIAGKVHQFDGPDGIGKNFLLYQYFAEVQRNYGDDARLAMACFESLVDKQFAQTCGCKIAMSPYDIEVTQRARELRGEQPLTDEEIREALSVPGVGTFHVFEGQAEQVLDGIVEAVKANIFQIIGVDSWDAMITAADEDKDLEEARVVASSAGIQTRWSQKIYNAFNPIYRCPSCGYAPLGKRVTESATMNYKWFCPNETDKAKCGWSGLDPAIEVNETSVYCIRQVRARIDMSGRPIKGRPYESKGARALMHLNHLRTSMHAGKYLTNKSGQKLGKEVNWEITKAKSGAREGTAGQFLLYFGPTEVDKPKILLNQCLKHGIVTKGAGYFNVPDIDMERVQGENKFLGLIEREPQLMSSLRELLFIKAGLSHVRFV